MFGVDGFLRNADAAQLKKLRSDMVRLA